MKRKLMAIVLALMLALSMTAFAVTAFADEKTPNDEITSIAYEDPLGYGKAFMVKGFSQDSGTYWTSIGMENYVVVTKADGTVVSGVTVESCGSQVAILRGKGFDPAEGDSILFKAGFTYGACYLDEDVEFIYGGTTFVKQVNIPVKDEITNLDYENAAGGYGMAFVAKGFSVAGGYWASIGMEDYVVVTKADGNVVTGVTVECCGTQLAIGRNQNIVPAKGDSVRFKAGFVYGACHLGEDVVFIYNGSAFVKQIPESAISEITVKSVDYVAEGWGAPTVIFVLNLANNAAYGEYASGDLAHLSYKNAYGETSPLADCTYVNNGHFIARLAATVNPNSGEYTPMKGDIFTINKGFLLTQADKGERINEDYAYIFDGQTFIPYVPATHDVTNFAIANNEEENTVYIDSLLEIRFTYNEGALFTPKFTSSNEAVATVTADGVVRGITTGTTVIKAVVGSFESSFTVNVKPAPVVTGVRFDTSYDIVTEKGAEAKIPDNFTVVKIFDDETTSAPIDLTAENARFKEAVDTSVVPAITGKTLAKIVVTIDDTEYELDIFVRITEVVDLKFTEAAVVEWFGFATFVEYPNCTTNKANFTSETEIKVADLENYLDHIEYLRDGEKVQVGSYLLGGGNIALFPPRADGGSDPINVDNFFETMYKQGDVIKLMKGLTVYGHSGVTDAANGNWSNKNGMLYREAVLQEDVMFRFAGTGWSLYVPYTDIEVESEEIEIALGSKNSVVGARRVPSNATSGTFKYVSSDETVLTVSENGKINALKVGEAIITVTLSGEESVGDKVATVKVKVTNKIVGLKITEKLILEPGTTEIDLSKVKGVYEYGDGSTEEATDLANAMVVGFDPEEKGEQVLTIRVKHNGVNYTANLIVEIREKTEESNGSSSGKKGCGSSAAGAAGLSVLAAAMVVVIGKKKR